MDASSLNTVYLPGIVLMADRGAVGKLPSTGDFVRIGLPRSFVKPWDEWMSSWLGDVKADAGDKWSADYLTSPIWRFSIAAGVLERRQWLGVMAPSVDRVGRQFPLCIALATQEPFGPGAMHFTNDELYDALEELAIEAVSSDLSTNALDTRITDLPSPKPPVGYLKDPKRWVAADRTSLRAQLISSALGQDNKLSLWSADDGTAVCLIATRGMPTAREAAGFFKRPSMSGSRSKSETV